MNPKKLALCLLTGLLSATLMAGCGGDKGGDKSSDTSSAPKNDAPIAKFELKGEPDMTFPVGSKTAKVYELKGLAADEDFDFTGRRIAFAGDAIYICGEGKDNNGKEVDGALYKLPIKDMKLSQKEFIAECYAEGDSGRNLTVSGGNVLFEQKADGHKLGVYSGISLSKEPAKWKDDYDTMAGTLYGDDILMVRSLDTICVGKRDVSEIKNVKELAKNVRETVKLKDAQELIPVYIDDNEVFLSCQTNFDDFSMVLLNFDRQGKYLRTFDGIKNDPGEWAVTKHYILQAGYGGNMVIYDRENAKKVFDSQLRDMEPTHIFPMGDDMLLMCSDHFGELKFYIMNLE